MNICAISFPQLIVNCSVLAALLLDLILKTVDEVIDRETALPLISTDGVKRDGRSGGRDGSLATFGNISYSDGSSLYASDSTQRYISFSFIPMIYLFDEAAVDVEATTMAHPVVSQQALCLFNM